MVCPLDAYLAVIPTPTKRQTRVLWAIDAPKDSLYGADSLLVSSLAQSLASTLDVSTERVSISELCSGSTGTVSSSTPTLRLLLWRSSERAPDTLYMIASRRFAPVEPGNWRSTYVSYLKDDTSHGTLFVHSCRGCCVIDWLSAFSTEADPHLFLRTSLTLKYLSVLCL